MINNDWDSDEKERQEGLQMDTDVDKLEQAIELSQRVGHFFIALLGTDGFPYVNSARQLEQIAQNQFAIEEWVCPLTVKQLSENPKMAVLIWDPSTDDGFEILGQVLMFESQSFLNGFAPEVEQDVHLPQVKRKLIIRAERITAFRHALRCDEIQVLAEGKIKSSPREDSAHNVPFCTYAPEWAEHARFDRMDDGCDDGRAGAV
jgi:uncharacterized protein